MLAPPYVKNKNVVSAKLRELTSGVTNLTGIHDAAVFTRLSEMETEIRTRLWCYTVLWDWYELITRSHFLHAQPSAGKWPNGSDDRWF